MLISVDDARARVLARGRRLPAERVRLPDALHRVLDEEIVAREAVPPFRNAAMDGYALRVADVAAATPDHPVRLRVTGEAAAGRPLLSPLGPGEAVRIMTGAPLPDGAEAVVRFEESSEIWPPEQRPPEGWVAIGRAARMQENVRLAGEDLQPGQRVLSPGSRLRPAQLGVLAALGWVEVAVVRRPRVAIIATGDELVAPGEPLGPGQIRNSNETTLTGMVQAAGGVPLPLGIAKDTIQSVRDRIDQALDAGADLVLTSAGVSVGDYDVVKAALDASGEMAFWQVAIKPGKPLAFGLVDRGNDAVPLLGLPGNPVASIVAFHVFGWPLIRTMLGLEPQRPQRHAPLAEPVTNSGRRHYMRARLMTGPEGRPVVTTRESGVRVQGSGILSSMLWANCYAVIPEGVRSLQTGDLVAVERFDWEEDRGWLV